MGDEIERRVAELGDVVRRDRSRHADRDALRAVGEQVRDGRRHHDRLFGVARVIVAPVDRILVDALHQEAGDVGHARFGVAVGGGVVAVDVAEIALPLDQRIARGEILGEPHQRLVDRLVAVRMERAHHVADDLRAFLEGRAGIEPEDVHAVEDAAMHRCDVDPYHGWVMAYDPRTLAQKAVLNVNPDGSEAGIWLSDTGPAVDSEGNLYVPTGNGTFDATSGGRDYGDSVLKLDGSSSPSATTSRPSIRKPSLRVTPTSAPAAPRCSPINPDRIVIFCSNPPSTPSSM